MAETVTPVEKKIAGTAGTAANAVSTYNTAIAAGVTAAQAVANVSLGSIRVVPGGMSYDGTNWLCYGSVTYNVVVIS